MAEAYSVRARLLAEQVRRAEPVRQRGRAGRKRESLHRHPRRRQRRHRSAARRLDVAPASGRGILGFKRLARQSGRGESRLAEADDRRAGGDDRKPAGDGSAQSGFRNGVAKRCGCGRAPSAVSSLLCCTRPTTTWASRWPTRQATPARKSNPWLHKSASEFMPSQENICHEITCREIIFNPRSCQADRMEGLAGDRGHADDGVQSRHAGAGRPLAGAALDGKRRRREPDGESIDRRIGHSFAGAESGRCVGPFMGSCSARCGPAKRR